MPVDRSPLFPPAEFAARLNASEAREDKTLLTMTDPLALLLWHTANEVAIRPARFLVLGSGSF